MRLSTVLVTLTLAACGHDAHEEENINEEACEHMQEGPAVAVVATASAQGAPDVSQSHRRYDMTLDNTTQSMVSFAASHASEYTFFLSANVLFTVHNDQGTEVEIEHTENPFAACADVAVSHTLDLQVGTHLLHLGPSASVVGLVVEQAEHEH